MANLGALMGLGQGMTAAGQVIDRHFVQQMEKMRLDSLAKLESRKLDIMEGGQKSEAAYRKSMLSQSDREGFEKSKAAFQERMDKLSEKITARLPENVGAEMMAKLMKQIMGDPNIMMEYTDTRTGDIDAERLGEVITALTSELIPPDMLTDTGARSAVERFAKSMVTEWAGIAKRYPAHAQSMDVDTILGQIPSFYGYAPQGDGLMAQGGQQGPPPPQGQAGGGLMAQEPTGVGKLVAASTGLGESVTSGLMSVGDTLRGYPSAPQPQALTPNQQQAQALGFDRGIRQTPQGPGSLMPLIQSNTPVTGPLSFDTMKR